MIVKRARDSARTDCIGGSVEEFIARENIKRFEAQLAYCTDGDQRSTLLKLLDEERARLATLRKSKPS